MIWPFIIISYFSLFVFGLTDNIRGPLFPEILKAYEVSDSFGSWMFALSAMSGFMASYGTRQLLRRYDRKAVLQGGCLGLIAALLGMGWSPSFTIFLFCSLVFGLSSGVIGLIPNVLVPLGAPSAYKQRLLSGLHAMYGLASLCAPLLVAQVGALTGNWRHVFVVAALGPLGLFLYSLHSSHKNLYLKPPPRLEKTSFKIGRHLWPQIFLAMMLSFDVAGEIMISSRLALFMRREWNFDLEHSSLYVTYFFISMLVGRSFFAFVHLKHSIRLLLTSSIVLTLVFGLAGLFFHPFFLALTGLAIAPFYPLTIAYMSNEFPGDLDAAISYMMATDSLMLVVMHLLIGKLTDDFGIRQALLIGMLFFVVSLILISSYDSLFKRNKSQNPVSP